MQHIHDIIERSEPVHLPGDPGFASASTKSVLARKPDQAEVDNLLEALGI